MERGLYENHIKSLKSLCEDVAEEKLPDVLLLDTVECIYKLKGCLDLIMKLKGGN